MAPDRTVPTRMGATVGVVITGMHRSGTSMLASGLPAWGWARAMDRNSTNLGQPTWAV